MVTSNLAVSHFLAIIRTRDCANSEPRKAKERLVMASATKAVLMVAVLGSAVA